MTDQQYWAYNKKVAIATNYYHIKKEIERDKIKGVSNELALQAAKYSYKKYGFGTAMSITEYLEIIENSAKKRLYNVNVRLWYKIIKEVFKRDDYTCQYCFQVGGKLECDHIIPFSKGGTDTMDNLITSCRKCNRQKKDKTVEEFLNWRRLN
ncbi:HNH endonuclease [bacterium]|nr:HNH endonuclease [bacterium]